MRISRRRPGLSLCVFGRGPHQGFTLIELLIVVGIISILAAIATPNFLEAQTRAKVSRVLNDARVVATALESYAVDNSKYPYRQEASLAGGILPYRMGRVDTKMKDLKCLTTPISYIATVPKDVFDQKTPQPDNILDYWSREITQAIFKDGNRVYFPTHTNPGWVVLSVGPDGSLGYKGNVDGAPPDDDARNTLYSTYDPTNGTISYGNIFRLQSNAEPGSAFSN